MCGCSKSLVSIVRGDLVRNGQLEPLPQGHAAHSDTKEEKPMATKKRTKQHETNQPADDRGGGEDAEPRIEELTNNIAYYEARVAELTEACADLAIENMRLRRAVEA